MPALTPAHWLASMVPLVPDTLNIQTFEGLELVANARVSPVQLPLVVHVNVCGKVTEAPAEGLPNVAAHVGAASVNDRKLALAVNVVPLACPMVQ